MGAEKVDSNGTTNHSVRRIIAGPLDVQVVVSRDQNSQIRVILDCGASARQQEHQRIILHWGIVCKPEDDHSVYIRPPRSLWPEKTDPRNGEPSVQSQFDRSEGGNACLRFFFPESEAPAGIVCLFIVNGHWMKGPGGQSFYIDVDVAVSDAERKRRADQLEEEKRKEAERTKEEERRKAAEAEKRTRLLALEAEQKENREKDAKDYLRSNLNKSNGEKLFFAEEHSYECGSVLFQAVQPQNKEAVEDTQSDAGTEADEEADAAKLVVASTIALGGSDIVLHWGVKYSGPRSHGWSVPPKESWPPKTIPMLDGKAVQTTLAPHGKNGLRVAVIENLPRGIAGVLAVIHIPDADNRLKWLQGSKGGDIYVPVVPKAPLKGLPKGYLISDVATGVVENIIEREMEYGSWTLMHRYSYGNHLISSVVGNDLHAWCAVYVWMRYSQIRVLDWQRNYNTKPRELSHAQLSFVTCLANRFCSMPDVRWLARLVMSCVGRGGSGDLGQRIRDDILVILRHNRGWGHGSMMEQWHQKLHNATDPTDVVICDALLAFWHSNGNRGEYWRVLMENGVTRERLASYEQAVTSEPDYVPHIRDTMIGELTQYGGLLKAVHLGTDLNSIVGRCQGIMHGDTRDKVNGFMYARGTAAPLLDILRAVAHARETLTAQIIFGGADDHNRRDLIFLDLALESETRRCVESVDGVSHDGTLWSHLVAVWSAAQSLKASETGLRTEGELDRAIHEIYAVIDRLERQGESHDIGLRAAAGLTLMRNAVTDIVDRYESSLGPLARCMGSAFGAETDIVSTFIEEAVRGGPAYVLSSLMRKAEPAVRRVAKLGPYSIIAPCSRETVGPLVVFHRLRESIGAVFKRNTVVVADICDGDEDVPKNTAYVVIGSTVDVLSHVSVRARNERHGLVACLDEDELQNLRTMHGCMVKASITGETFNLELVDERGRMSPSAGVRAVMRRIRSASGFITPPSGMQTPPIDMRSPGAHSRRGSMGPGHSGHLQGILSPGGQALVRKLSAKSLGAAGKEKEARSERQLAAPWALRPSEFNSELVGSKSLNLQRLVALGMAEWIKTPTSLAIPNGAMKKVMQSDENSTLMNEYNRCVEKISKAKPGDVKLCAKLREIILSLSAPEGLNEALRGILDDLGCEDLDEALPGAWKCVKGVWASLWNERAHLARQKLKLDIHDVDMAVLCQKVIDADYAFVIHTTNPLTGDKNEIYAECVVGLGETLVGNAPGQSLGFTVRKDEDLDTTVPIVRSYPSKAMALIGGEYIFRSDSNAEDLDGFAGAGLHDSIPVVKNKVVDIDYSQERIMIDDDFRIELMRGIAKIGVEVEDIMGGSPQDIEGCFMGGEFYVVQARPQV